MAAAIMEIEKADSCFADKESSILLELQAVSFLTHGPMLRMAKKSVKIQIRGAAGAGIYLCTSHQINLLRDASHDGAHYTKIGCVFVRALAACRWRFGVEHFASLSITDLYLSVIVHLELFAQFFLLRGQWQSNRSTITQPCKIIGEDHATVLNTTLPSEIR